jgi:hypothetical protein
MRSSTPISDLAKALLSFVGLPAPPLPIAVGKVLTWGGLRPSPLMPVLAPGTGTGTDPAPILRLEGAPDAAFGGEPTVEACGIVCVVGIAVPTDC